MENIKIHNSKEIQSHIHVVDNAKEEEEFIVRIFVHNYVILENVNLVNWKGFRYLVVVEKVNK